MIETSHHEACPRRSSTLHRRIVAHAHGICRESTTANANDELATPALRAATAAGSTHSSAASSVIASSFLEQAEDVKATLLVAKKKKTREGSDPYANSKFEGICKDVVEGDTANWMFCEVLCAMCEYEGECCVSKHLGCHSNPTLIQFLAKGGPPASPACAGDQTGNCLG